VSSSSTCAVKERAPSIHSIGDGSGVGVEVVFSVEQPVTLFITFQKVSSASMEGRKEGMCCINVSLRNCRLHQQLHASRHAAFFTKLSLLHGTGHFVLLNVGRCLQPCRWI